jgi:predicted N-acetyltransferase YhbS
LVGCRAVCLIETEPPFRLFGFGDLVVAEEYRRQGLGAR